MAMPGKHWFASNGRMKKVQNRNFEMHKRYPLLLMVFTGDLVEFWELDGLVGD